MLTQKIKIKKATTNTTEKQAITPMEFSDMDQSDFSNIKNFLEIADQFGANNAIDRLLNEQDDLSKSSKRGSFHNQSLESFESLESFGLDDSDLWNHDIAAKPINTMENFDDIDLCSSDLEEDEILKNNEAYHFCFINLDGRFKFTWDHIQLLLMIYVVTLVPWKICFVEDGEFPLWEYFDYFIDFLFVIDLVLNFFTPIMRKERIIFSHKAIALSYLKLWFWIDFLSVFPFNLLLSGNNTDYSILLRISKVPRLYKFIRGAKMLRTIKVQKNGRKTFVGRIISYFSKSDSIFTSVVPVFALSLCIAHILACGWYFLANNSSNADTWLRRYAFADEAWYDRYWASLYYIYTTFTTTGYGDIVPNTSDEFLFTIIIVCVGVSFYSYVFSHMMLKLAEYNAKNKEFNKKKLLLKQL